MFRPPILVIHGLIIMLILAGLQVGPARAEQRDSSNATGEKIVTFTGKIVSISKEKREIGLMERSSRRVVTILVDDPKRLSGLKEGMPVRIEAVVSAMDGDSYSAKRIVAPGWGCRCDPTGVRGRMRRGWKRWGCGRGCCDRR